MKSTLTQYGKASKIILVQALVICCVTVLLLFTGSITINGVLAILLTLIAILLIYYKKIILETLHLTKDPIILSQLGLNTVKDFNCYINFLRDLGVFIETNGSGDSQKFMAALNNSLKSKFKTRNGTLKEVSKDKAIRKDYSKLCCPQVFDAPVNEEIDVIVSTLVQTEYSFEKVSKPIVSKDFSAERLTTLTRIYLSTYHSNNRSKLKKVDKIDSNESIQIELDNIKVALKDKMVKKRK